MKRIQIKRTKGYKMPPNSKYVGRPGKWGNPFKVEEYGSIDAIELYRECIKNPHMAYYYFEEIEATIQFDRFTWMSENLHTLKNYDSLACFCPLDQPCHVDVLINLIKHELC